MNKTIRNLLIAFAAAVVAGFLFGLLGSLAGVRWGFLGTLIPAMFGVFTYYILFNLSGTRKEAKADAAAQADALAFAAPAGLARVYVLRTGFAGKAAGMDITVDGAALAQLKSPRFTLVDVAPGAHEFHARFSGGAGPQNRECSMRIEVAAGSVTVLRISVALGLMKNQLLIATVPLEAARADIARATMVAAAKPA